MRRGTKLQLSDVGGEFPCRCLIVMLEKGKFTVQILRLNNLCGGRIMKYELKGETLPVVICYLENGEAMITERGSMSWMSPNMKMETTSNGGIGKAFGRMFAGEAIFQNRYTAMGGNGMIAFASSFPGSILDYQIAPGRELIVQKSGFLAAEAGVELSVFFQKKLGAGFFGG